MDMFFRTKKSLIKMKDKVEVEVIGKDKNYLITSSLNGQETCILGQYSCEQKALEILNRIDELLDKAIKENANNISINIPSDEKVGGNNE